MTNLLKFISGQRQTLARGLFVLLLVASVLSPLEIPQLIERVDLLLMSAAALMLILINFEATFKILKNFNIVGISLATFYSWLWICAWASQDIKIAVKHNILASIYLLIFFALLTILELEFKIKNGNSLIYSYLIFCFLSILALIGFVEYITPDILLFRAVGAAEQSYYPRISSLLNNPNSLGVLMSLGILLAFYLKKIKIISNFEFCWGVFLLLITSSLAASRNGWLILLSVFFLSYLYKIISLKKGIILLAIWLAVLLLFPVSNSRLRIQEKQYSKSNTISRISLWKAAGVEIIKHPLTGIGLGVYEERVGRKVTGRIGFHAHNIFLNVWVETGTIGLLLFLNLLVSIIKKVNFRSSLSVISIILIFLSQLVDFFIADPTFMVVALYFFAIASYSAFCESRERGFQ
ncbi:MAG TPA: hypothetical protein DCF68_04195 [Cyanothece sp. UBA12306]|nr:hypothetical protein [Cyanothece sp. UBA12306]